MERLEKLEKIERLESLDDLENLEKTTFLLARLRMWKKSSKFAADLEKLERSR
jgi:hypothetical protein